MLNKKDNSELLILKDNDSQKILNELCIEKNINTVVLKNLIIWMHKNEHRERRHGLTSEFDDIFTNTNYWSE